jgi:hypothetical protein
VVLNPSRLYPGFRFDAGLMSMFVLLLWVENAAWSSMSGLEERVAVKDI